MAGRRAGVAAVVALALGLSMAACSATAPPSLVGKQTLRIGVKADQPGLGLRQPNGTFAGFDVDVARYVAGRLGVRPDHITFVPVTSATRETALETGSVDLVDGSVLRMPGTLITGADGKNMENNPRPVDIAVSRPIGESYTGKDSQLDAAVKELLAEIH